MGKRRMFSTEIVRSDAFLDLPVSSRELYFQLGMDTDDRGYVSNARSVIRLIGASLGDLEPLVNKGFLMVRGESLILQKHFRINNTIRSDRFKETEYISDLKKLFIKENGSYTEEAEKGKPMIEMLGIPSGNQTDTQVNLIKDNTSKDNLIEDNLIKDNSLEGNKDSNNGNKPNAFVVALVNLLITSGYIEKGSMDEVSITEFVIKKLLNEGMDEMELNKRIKEFNQHIEMVDLEEIENKQKYLLEYLTDDDNLPF